ncbi:MAG: cell division protein FtsZ [Candidatus Moraniibacteriota bacterium]|nr:MAG: cell division protein FtsZ [Candidatus Moranbacteria bacterium]
MAEIKPDIETFAKIKVVGIGGGGGNAIVRMVDSDIKGVEYVAINTDAQALHHSSASEKVHIGKNLTKGLGAGMNPEVGRQAAEENRAEIQEILKGSEMVFITCGLGGGTGTGAAPIVAETAREVGALTVGVVTKPFSFEGAQRRAIAMEGLEILKDRVDALITIPNDKLLSIIDKKTTLINAFRIVDDVLRQGVQGISDLITKSGIINVDFADVRAILGNSGSALMGIGIASGENRASQAAKSAINSPLLELSIDGAKGVLFTVTGGADVTMMEINEAASIITEAIDPNAKVIFGAVMDDQLRKGELQITVVATGFDPDRPSKAITPSMKTVQEEKLHQKEENIHDGDVVKKEEMQTSDFSHKKNIQTNNSFNSRPVSGIHPQAERNNNYGQSFKSPSTTPTMITEDKIQQRPPVIPSPLDDIEPIEEDFDVPAFIRRKLGGK